MVKKTLNDLKQYVYDIMNSHESSESSLSTGEISDYINNRKRKRLTSEFSDASSLISYDVLMSEPTPPQTALQYFIDERLNPILQSLKNHLSYNNVKTEVESLLRRQWGKMTPFEKFRYEHKADQDYERYLSEMHELHQNSVDFIPKRVKTNYNTQQKYEQTLESTSLDHSNFNCDSHYSISNTITEDDTSYFRDFSNFDLLSDEFIHCFSSDEDDNLCQINSNSSNDLLLSTNNSIYPPIDFSYQNNRLPILFSQYQSSIIPATNVNNKHNNYLASSLASENTNNSLSTSQHIPFDSSQSLISNIITNNDNNNTLLSTHTCQQEYSIIALKLLTSVMRAGH